MPGFVTLACPTCGGKLEITPDIDRFVCAHCGNEHLVNRTGGIISIKPVLQALGGIQRGTDLTAAELAIRRLKEEIPPLGLAKGEATRDIAAWQSAIAQARAKKSNLRLAGYAAAATTFLVILTVAGGTVIGSGWLGGDAKALIQIMSFSAGLAAIGTGAGTLICLYASLSIASPQPLAALEAGVSSRQQDLDQIEAASARAEEELQHLRSIVSTPR